MVFNLEQSAEFHDHSIVKIGTIVHDDPFKYSIPTNEVLLDELGDNILGDGSEEGCLNPLGKIINAH